MRWFFHRRAFAGNDAKSEKKAVQRFFYVKNDVNVNYIYFYSNVLPPPLPQYANFVRILSSIPNKKLYDRYNSISFKLQWI